MQKVFNDLGIIDEARKIVELEKLLQNNKSDLGKLSQLILELRKPIVFVEDEKTQIYKIAWLKLKNLKIRKSLEFLTLMMLTMTLMTLERLDGVMLLELSQQVYTKREPITAASMPLSFLFLVLEFYMQKLRMLINLKNRLYSLS